MTAIFEKITFYWTYPFVRYAIIVGVLIALCSSLLGVTLVLKRFSFIGDGLSHVAFGAMSIAAVLKLTDDMPLTLGVTVVCAVLLLRTGQNTKIKGDAAIAMISVGALAIGYLLMNLFSTSSNLSGAVRHAPLSEFPVRDRLLRHTVGELRGAGHSNLHSGGDAGGFHHRGGGYSGIFDLFGPWPSERRYSMMKQLFCLLLAACMTVSLCACGKGSEKDAGKAIHA